MHALDCVCGLASVPTPGPFFWSRRVTRHRWPSNQDNHITRIATLMRKISSEEPFDETDWNDAVHMAFIIGHWLMERSDIRLCPETRQVHIQETRSSQRRRKRKTK